MKHKLNTITTIVFGLMIFSLVKYYIKESEKQVTKEPIVDTITIIDKNNRNGYLIFVDKYYIFQPFDQNEDVPIYYRTKYIKPISQSISLSNYLNSLRMFFID